MKLQITKMLTVLLALFFLTSLMSTVYAEDEQNVRFKGKVVYLSDLDTYVLRADDKRRFHPIKRLPPSFRENELDVVVEGKLHKEMYGRTMYGTAIEVTNITLASKYVSPEEQQALELALARMDAFNTRDLTKLQQIDVLAQNLTLDDFTHWLGNGEYKYTLHYIEVTLPSGSYNAEVPITGFCLYSKKIVNGMSLSGDIRYSLMKFTIANIHGQWKFISTGNYSPDTAIDPNQYIADLLKITQEKYGTTDLPEIQPVGNGVKH
ncbi:MAG: hypothetical protein H6Q67_133 [Firmicutes bacterium]|nr:hypothetical protein [Bacillota bacterium]